MTKPRNHKAVYAAALIAFAAIVPILVPSASSHGAEEGFGHLNVKVDDLSPGESHYLVPDPTEGPRGNEAGPLKAGWIFIVYGGVQGNASIRVTLSSASGVVAQWEWAPEAWNKNTVKLNDTGAHELVLYNPSPNQTVRYGLYFDMSCNCAGKLIPLPGGYVLFNFDLPADRDVSIDFPLAPDARVRGIVATGGNTTGRWPDDFERSIETETQLGQPLRFSFKTTEATRYYVWVEALAGASLQKPLDLAPQVDVSSAAEAPGPGVWAILVGVLAAVLWARRR